MPLVRRALKVLSDREVSPQLGLLKSTLLQLDSTFSERTYGAGSFRDFAQKLAAAGHVVLREAGRNVLVELAEGVPARAEDAARAEPRRTGRVHDSRARDTRDAQPAAPAPAERRPPPSRAWPTGSARCGGCSSRRRIRRAGRCTSVRRSSSSGTSTPTFDERKFGFASLVDLMRACQREGLFRIERDRQGVMRIFPGNVMQMVPEPVTVEPEETEESGQGRIQRRDRAGIRSRSAKRQRGHGSPSRGTPASRRWWTATCSRRWRRRSLWSTVKPSPSKRVLRRGVVGPVPRRAPRAPARPLIPPPLRRVHGRRLPRRGAHGPNSRKETPSE